MIKAIFFDIDGTLVSFRTHRMPDSTINALESLRKKGIKIFVATGRHISVINNLGNTQFDGYITMNGCCCLAGQNDVIYKRSIPQSDIRSFVHYLKEVNSIPCLFVEEHRLTVNIINDEVKDVFNLLKFVTIPVENIDYYNDKEIFQLSAFFPEEEEDEIMKTLPNCTTMRWYPSFTDIITTGVSKAVGIDKIGEYFGFQANEVMAFGDGGNDIDMLRHAKIGIAMGNADDAVKDAADYITDTVDNDGIEKALKYFNII